MCNDKDAVSAIFSIFHWSVATIKDKEDGIQDNVTAL